MHRYLYKFLTSVDANLQHIAVWTIMQLLEFGETQLVSNIRRSNPLIPAARQLEMLPMPSPTASPGTPPSHHSQTQSYQDTEADDEDGEIQLLVRRTLDIVGEDIDAGAPRRVTSSHIKMPSFASSRG